MHDPDAFKSGWAQAQHDIDEHDELMRKQKLLHQEAMISAYEKMPEYYRKCLKEGRIDQTTAQNRIVDCQALLKQWSRIP